MYIQKALEARLQVITTTATVCITMLELSLQNSLGFKDPEIYTLEITLMSERKNIF